MNPRTPDQPPQETTFLGTDTVNGEPCSSINDRLTRCYELAVHAVAWAPGVTDRTLVHGTIDGGPGTAGRIGHAWVILPDQTVWEPVTARLFQPDRWEAWAHPRTETTYTADQVRQMLHNHAHYGPWHTPTNVDGTDT